MLSQLLPLLSYKGGSVVDLMQKRGVSTLPIGEAVAIILQVLDGLTYTHNAEIAN